MRIVDWSSDVCSSDLFVTDAIDVDHQPWRLLVREDSPQPADHPPRLRNKSVLMPVRPAVALMCAWVKATASASAASACSLVSPMFSSKRTTCCTWALSARSEEHTSELQSLMRISYAVFCLTKK